jgi:hypothetical protein
VAATFGGAPPSCNRSAVVAMLVEAAARAGKQLTCSDKGLHWR